MRRVRAHLLSLLCFAPLCLAAAEPGEGSLSDPNSWQSMGWIIAGIFGIVGLANQGMALWDRLFPRVQPPVHETYATKAELQALAKDLKEDNTRIEGRFEEWLEENQTTHRDSVAELRRTLEMFSEWQRTIERVIGRVETKADLAASKKS